MIAFNCPGCNLEIKVPDQAGGRTGTCPRCHVKVRVPDQELPAAPLQGVRAGAAPAAPSAPAPVPAPVAQVPCPSCGEMISAQAKKCRFCGEELAPAQIPCPSCGEMISTKAVQCRYCGEQLGRPAASARRASSRYEDDDDEPRPQERNAGRNKAVDKSQSPISSRINTGMVIAVLVAALLIGGGIVALSVYRADDNEKLWIKAGQGDLPALRALAEGGDTMAQCKLGFRYQKGDGVARDEAEAMKWLRMAAEQGDADAQFQIGCYYHDGKVVARDKSEAVKWWRKAATQGNQMAKAKLMQGISDRGTDGY